MQICEDKPYNFKSDIWALGSVQSSFNQAAFFAVWANIYLTAVSFMNLSHLDMLLKGTRYPLLP